MMNRVPTAAIYIRLSKEDRNKLKNDDDSESITNQRRMLLDYCRENEINVYDIYNDEDFSGSDRDRPEFNRMIEDARNRKIDLVICKTQSRFARDMEIVEKYINGLFPIWGVRFIGVVDRTDSMNSQTLKQRQLNSLVDQWYISDLSENIRATLSSKRKQGLWVGAFAPYGYKKDPGNKNHLVIDEEAAAIVRYVFSLYLSGVGITAITRRLNDEGIPNPATYKQQHGQPFQNAHGECSDIWHTYSISRMLSNEVYIGNVVQGMSENVSYKSTKKRQKSKSEWDIVENAHEPIIDRDIWDSVQSLRASKPKSLNGNYTPNIFAGKVRCAACGGSMRIFYSRKRRYYRCSTRFIATSHCSGKYISESVLHRTVLNEIRELYSEFIDEEAVANKIELKDGIADKVKSISVSIDSAEKEITQLDKRIEALYIDKLDGLISKEEYVTLKNSFVDQRNKLESRIEHLNMEKLKLEEERKRSQNKLELIRKHKDICELDFDTVRTLIDHVEIGGDRNNRVVNIYWNL